MNKEELRKSPRPKDKDFTKYWNIFIEDIIERENVKKTHIQQLIILCQLRKEFDTLSNLISEEGYIYTTETRNGTQQKISGNVLVRDKVISEIRQYSRLLNITLDKDKDKNESDTSDWD